MDYQEIVKANETIKTTKIQGKDYAEVNQRIKAFRMLYPEGFILTEFQQQDNVVIFTAKVGYEDEKGLHILATGTAYEKENSTFINKTSYIENCETSAVGRALGMLGLGVDTSVASAEEVENAIAQQEIKKATPVQVKKLAAIYTGELLTKLLERNKIEKLEDLPLTKASEIIKKLQEQKGE